MSAVRLPHAINSQPLKQNAFNITFEELQSATFEELTSPAEKIIPEILLLRSGRILTKQTDKDDSIIVKVWDLKLKGENRCILSKKMGKWSYSFLSEINDELLIDENIILQDELKAKGLINPPVLLSEKSCYLGSNEYIILTHTQAATDYFYFLHIYNSKENTFNMMNHISYSSERTPISICSPREGVFCICHNKGIDLFHKTSIGTEPHFYQLQDTIFINDFSKPVFWSKRNLKESVTKCKFSFYCLRALSENEVAFCARSTVDFGEGDYLIKINIENYTLTQVACSHANTFSFFWHQAMPFSLYPPILALRTNLHFDGFIPSYSYLFHANEMIFTALPLESGTALHAITPEGDLLLRNEKGIKMVSHREFKAYRQVVKEEIIRPIQEILPVRDVAAIVVAYVGQDLKYSPDFPRFFKPNKNINKAEPSILYVQNDAKNDKSNKSDKCLVM